MNHLSEEQLILHYYGEEGDAFTAEQHLDGCEDCRALYGSLQRVLNMVDSMPLPQRGADYGAQVWNRLAPQIPVRRRSHWWSVPSPFRWATAGVAFAGLLVAAFVAGRFYPSPIVKQPVQVIKAETQTTGERVLLVAVGDYLERSHMVLVKLANSDPGESMDISSEQERASDLVSESRLYRQTAEHTGNTAVANILDDVDRVLLEISHSPAQLSAQQLSKLRQRLEAEDILFKIRVLGSNVRNQEEPAATTVRQKL